MKRNKSGIEKLHKEYREINNGFTLIELLIVLAFVIAYIIQIKLIATDLFQDLEITDYSFGFISATLIISVILTLFLVIITSLADTFWDKNIFFKFLSIILFLTCISMIAYCSYYSRSSIFFIILNIILSWFVIGAWLSAFFEKRQKFKKRKK
jgi:hypothetical protein